MAGVFRNKSPGLAAVVVLRSTEPLRFLFGPGLAACTLSALPTVEGVGDTFSFLSQKIGVSGYVLVTTATTSQPHVFKKM